MANAPIIGSKDISDSFTKSQTDADFGFLQIGIDFDTNSFKLLQSANKKDSDEETWKTMQSSMEDKNHTYFIARDPSDSKLYILIHFAPDLAPVKQRMLYASSRGTLKGQLGSANFSNDYHISKREECSLNVLKQQRDLHKTIDFRSDSEIEKQLTNHETAPKSVRGQVMKNLPIQMTDSATKAIESYKNDQAKCVILSLEDDQSIKGEEQKAQTIDEIRELISENEPRYLLFSYSKSTENDSDPQQVFAYYCPDKADRKLKFTYSTCKANVIDYCTEQEIDFYAKVEISSLADFTAQFLDYHVFPEKQEKELFNVPKAPGKKGDKKRKKLDV